MSATAFWRFTSFFFRSGKRVTDHELIAAKDISQSVLLEHAAENVRHSFIKSTSDEDFNDDAMVMDIAMIDKRCV